MFDLLVSIDIIDGRAVRLRRGNPAEASFYDKSPAEYAALWSGLGFTGIHVVDLDAALGRGDNTRSVAAVLSSSRVPVQVGGGVRSVERAERLLRLGATKVVISSIVFTNQEEALLMLKRFGPERVVAALDFDEKGVVATHGWQAKTRHRLVEALERAERMGFTRFMITDTSRDGTLLGINTSLLSKVPEQIRQNIYVAGGIKDLQDLKLLREMGFRGAVLGKALYEGKISPRQAVSMSE